LTDGLPVILAGDEMQSIAPSGFTFAGCQEDLESLAKEHNFKVNVRVSKMQENFRNLPLIAELTTSVQRLALKEHKNRELNVPTVHRSSEGPGIVEKIMRDEFGSLNHTVLASLTSMASAKVLPCRYEEKEHFIDSKEFARGIGVDPDSLPNLDPQAFSTVEECKGLEFPTIILCGFAKALTEAIGSQNLQWILSALTVAVSRARNHVIFLDADDSWPVFYQRLSTDGRFPVERLSTTERIEISLDEEIDILVEKFNAVALLKDEAERSVDEVDRTIRILKKETDAIAEEAKLSRFQNLRLGRVRRLLASWCRYIESKSIETRNWEEFARYDSGLFGRMVNRAIDDRAASSLKTLFEVQSEYVGNLTAELFIASCIIATDSNFNGTHPERVQLFAEYVEQFSARSHNGWIADLARNNAKAASFYDHVVKLLKTPTTDWEPDSLDRAVNDLSIIDPKSPLAAYVDVCGSLSDAESAQKKLSKWRAILTAADDTHFERVVLIRLFGLAWVDDEALLTQLGDLLTSGSDLDKSLRSLMNTEAARECARRNLETILSNIRSTDGSEGPSQLFVSIAAVSSVVNDDLDDLVKALQNVKSSFQYS
jgi:hypothetical protein